MEIIILDLFSDSFASYVSASSTPGVVRTKLPPLIELVTNSQSNVPIPNVSGRAKQFGTIQVLPFTFVRSPFHFKFSLGGYYRENANYQRPQFKGVPGNFRQNMPSSSEEELLNS